MEIVPMETGHYEGLIQLWSSFPGNALTGADSEANFTSFLEANGGFCFTAFSGERLAGSVMAGHDTRRGYVYHLAVAGDLQDRGLGRMLMERCEEALRSAGIEKVHLFIFTDNTAVEFYRKAGWHLREDILVMSKVLDGDPMTGTRNGI
jgi:ribosomal protein S18 acetylase RimI-like enzyme